MVKWLAVLVALLAAALAGFYTLLYQPQQEALAQVGASAERESARADEAEREARLHAQSMSLLNSRVAELETLLEDLRQTSAQLATQVAERESQLEAQRSMQEELVEELQQEIAEGQIQVKRLKGQVRVDMDDEILFDSGAAAVKPAGRAVLQRIAEVLKRTRRMVQIQGHTDNVPIVGRLAQRYATNWELSAARAVNVARYLHEEAGLDPALLSASGLSEYRPRASNENEAGRRENRRIEIVLGPKLDDDAEP